MNSQWSCRAWISSSEMFVVPMKEAATRIFAVNVELGKLIVKKANDKLSNLIYQF